VDLNLFKAFVAVAEARSFTRAAAGLHLTQPALSRQILRLETELRTKLFERYGRQVECTVDGEFLLPLAQTIISRTDEAVSLMRERAGVVANNARFGATGMVFAHFLAPILTSFIATRPGAKLDLLEADDVMLEESVVEGRLDCAVCTPWRSVRAASKYLLTEDILLVVACTHPFANLPAVSLRMLAGETVLLPPASQNVSGIIVDAVHEAGVAPKVLRRALYPELNKNLVRTGWGVAPMPRMLVTGETMNGLVAIPFEEKLTRDLVLIHPWDRPLPTMARALLTHIQAVATRSSIGSVMPKECADRSRRPRPCGNRLPQPDGSTRRAR
jgi:DNA-binding transcriptional LysR family regulator